MIPKALNGRHLRNPVVKVMVLEHLVLESKNQLLPRNEFIPHVVFDLRSLDGLPPNVGRDQKGLHPQQGSIHRCRETGRAIAHDDQVVPAWFEHPISLAWDDRLHYLPLPPRRENVPLSSPLLLPLAPSII